MEILKIVEALQSYTEDVVAYKLDSRFACAVTEAVKLLVEQERREHDQTKEDRESAESALKAAEQGKQAAEAELVAAQKRLKMADRDIMEYETLAQKLISDYNILNGLRKKITVHDREAGEKLKQFQTKMVTMMADALENVK